MAQTDTERLAAMVHANDKLLKGLTVLLALRDEHLLEDLRAVFAGILSESREMASGSNATWDHLRHELSLITALVEGDDPDVVEGENEGRVN